MVTEWRRDRQIKRQTNLIFDGMLQALDNGPDGPANYLSGLWAHHVGYVPEQLDPQELFKYDDADEYERQSDIELGRYAYKLARKIVDGETVR